MGTWRAGRRLGSSLLASGRVSRGRVILDTVTGSRAYGLDHATSDTDRRGVYLATADVQWSLAGAAEQLEDRAADAVYWELGKFVRLALRANPTALEVLWTPLVTSATPLGERLRAERGVFLSRRVAATFGNYAEQQFQKHQRRRDRTGEVRHKELMHLVRLLRSGVALLRTGGLPVAVPEQREELLAIRRGEVPAHAVEALRDDLVIELRDALATTALPPEPDTAAAERLLLDARRAAAGSETLP